MKYKECEECAARVGPVAFWGNFGLATVKGFVGVISGSRAVIADAVHSGADVIMAIVIYLSLKIGAIPPDENHRYGHGKVEFIASLTVSLILLVVAFLIIGYGISAIITRQLDEPDALAIWVSVLSIIGNEAMARHSICAAGQINSSAMLANGLENRADVYSSVAALLGVLGAKMGYVWLDPLAAAVVGGLILRSAYVISKDAIAGLIDKTNIGGHSTEKIIELIKKNSEVASINHIRSRRSGQRAIFDIGLAVDPSLTLAQLRPLKDRLKREIFNKLENVGFVNIRFSSIKEY